MHTAEYITQERGAPAVLAIAVNFALLYLLASGLGVVPSPLPQLPTVLVDTHESTSKPTPLRERPIAPRMINAGFVPSVVPSKPIIDIESTPIIPPTSDKPIIEIGGGDPPAEQSLTYARVLKNFEPPYPSFSVLSKEEGTVYVKVSISPYGLVGDAVVEKSSGFARLDEAALKAVRAWQFAPAKRGPLAIASWVVVPVKYVLNRRG
jgi:periplasmic protein TonB